jgi:hypothetical protein
MSYRFLIVLFAVLFGGFRWRWPKFMSRSRDPHGKRAEAARLRKEAKERKALQKEEAQKLAAGKK